MVGFLVDMPCAWLSTWVYIVHSRSLPTRAARNAQKRKNEISLFRHESGFAFTGSTTSTFPISFVWLAPEILVRMSLGTGRPIVLRDENSIRHCRVLLNHPMASPTDVRLVALVELIMQKSGIL